MKNYDQILSFGCSYTAGGGLDSPHYHAFLTNKLEGTYDKYHITPYMSKYSNTHSYPSYLSNLLKCSFINYGIGSSANELIYEQIYDRCNTITPDVAKSTLVTIQTSVLSRMYLFDVVNKIARTINNPASTLPTAVVEYYSQYIGNFFDAEFEYKKMVRNIVFIRSWLKSKGFDVAIIAADSVGELHSPFYKLPHGKGTLVEFMIAEKLTIADIPNITFIDGHMTEQGNKILAEILFNNLEEMVGYD